MHLPGAQCPVPRIWSAVVTKQDIEHSNGIAILLLFLDHEQRQELDSGIHLSKRVIRFVAYF